MNRDVRMDSTDDESSVDGCNIDDDNVETSDVYSVNTFESSDESSEGGEIDQIHDIPILTICEFVKWDPITNQELPTNRRPPPIDYRVSYLRGYYLSRPAIVEEAVWTRFINITLHHSFELGHFSQTGCDCVTYDTDSRDIPDDQCEWRMKVLRRGLQQSTGSPSPTCSTRSTRSPMPLVQSALIASLNHFTSSNRPASELKLIMKIAALTCPVPMVISLRCTPLDIFYHTGGVLSRAPEFWTMVMSVRPLSHQEVCRFSYEFVRRKATAPGLLLEMQDNCFLRHPKRIVRSVFNLRKDFRKYLHLLKMGNRRRAIAQWFCTSTNLR